ncbi:MAG: exodeoxyribonuclease III [Candidatus Paceibacterota bacterium]|jgi:exodeoxyribonuclease-3
MRILSWNVNGLRAIHKKGAFGTIFEADPDIICLQETKAHPEQLPEEVRSPLGYHSYFDHSKLKKGYSGVAIFSKVKPEKVEYGIGILKFDNEGRTLVAYYKDFVLLNVYFPNGGGGQERLDFKMEYYDEFLKFVDKLKKNGKDVVFCGDVNTAHMEIDLSRPKENEKNTGFLSIERGWIDKVISHGYIDTFRSLHPGKIQYSWWDMKTFARDRNIGWRIDYFFVSENLKEKIKKAEILDNIFGSDHCPILLELK